MYTIDFQPVGRRGKCPSDLSLLECARRLNVDLVSLCGGVRNCGRCKVQVIAGDVSESTADEETPDRTADLTLMVRNAVWRQTPRTSVIFQTWSVP